MMITYLNCTVLTVEPVYKGHPWDKQKWLLYRGGFITQSGYVHIFEQ